jgi:hypothetical protein
LEPEDCGERQPEEREQTRTGRENRRREDDLAAEALSR